MSPQRLMIEESNFVSELLQSGYTGKNPRLNDVASGESIALRCVPTSKERRPRFRILACPSGNGADLVVYGENPEEVVVRMGSGLDRSPVQLV